MKKKGKKPRNLKPMLSRLIDKPFDNEEWLFEIKLDGFRALAELDGSHVTLYSRNLISFHDRFPELVRECEKLQLDAIVDGEIVALDENGVSHFQLLQNFKTEENIFFYLFDLLYINGQDIRSLPLFERKRLLQEILATKKNSRIRYLDHIENNGTKCFAFCEQYGLEGIMGKRKESLYESGQRSKNWVKIKAEKRQEVIICGFTEPRGSRKGLGALLVGVYRNKKLSFAGHVGGGFTEKKLQEVLNYLSPLMIDHCPFTDPPKTNSKATWVKPKYLCEVKFKEWTSEGIMRMPIFLGIREDKAAESVTQEKPMEDFITNEDKIFWKKEKITKGDLIDYYDSVSHWILPYLKDRPESLKRFPNGIDQPHFFQKNMSSHPDWIRTFEIEHENKTVNYLLIQDKKSLLYAVNLGSIELHPWFSRIGHLEYPDFLVFDLDPGKIHFDAVVMTAQKIHRVLDQLGLPNYCKTSGGDGLHILVPLKARYTYEIAKHFALLIATLVHQELPEITSLERSPSKRKRQVYIDCYQNNFAQTLSAPYSVRAKPGAPVSTPLEWKEVKNGLDIKKFNIFTIGPRLKKKGDLLQPLLHESANLKKALKQL